MADLGFLPVGPPAARPDPARRPAAAVLGHPRRRRRRAGQALPAPTRSRTASTRRSRRSSTMTHHVLHVSTDDRLPVLVDLAAAPGRTLVFTRTKHGAKALARQLNARRRARGRAARQPGAERPRPATSRAFSDGTAPTLVATDIAARGIHVDDVSLVIHADPPVEHKAYLHRSGRTARAGAERHRRHADDRRPGRRRPRPDPQGRHHADHHPAAARRTRCCTSSPRASAPSPPRSCWPAGAGARGSGRIGPRRRPAGHQHRRLQPVGRFRRRGGSGNGGRQGAGREAAGAGAGASRAGGAKRPVTARTGGRSGSTTVYTSTSGGAAAFSAGTRAGSGRGGR